MQGSGSEQVQLLQALLQRQECEGQGERGDQKMHTSDILQPFQEAGSHSKKPGAYKIQHLLEREYGIKISAGRVYRLMNKDVHGHKAEEQEEECR